ncbi:DUF2637 domain-containing protein [Nonomuraea sediminis]|uniref:DUF2637 domain-containing protein n=1 Tax=Nonomuraea sediminis TaxID=2835864 RepID=UPI001BDC5DE1|nr:DUF2637 domain-containing protein [Nonomuraea sediminis]
MLKRILRRRGEEESYHPGVVNGHGLDSARFSIGPDGVHETRVYRTGPAKREPGERLSGRLLGIAGVLIFGALVGAGFVGYEAQRLFALLHNHTGDTATAADQVRAVIIAALPDVGWVAMALVALVAALRGQSSLRARIGVMVFFGLSLGAQLLYAPHTIEGMLVAVIAPVTMAWMLESYIVEVRRRVAAQRGLDIDETPILSMVLAVLGRLIRLPFGLPLWLLRLFLDRKGTWAGAREWVLDVAPIAPGRTLASIRAAEAEAIASSATLTAEQVREAAREQVEALQEAHARELREIAEARAAEAAARLEERQREQDENAQRVEQTEAEARVSLSRTQSEAQRTIDGYASRLQEAELKLHRLSERLQRAEADSDRLLQVERQLTERTNELGAVRAELKLVTDQASPRVRLAALYERLRLNGDRRYRDRAAVPELARTWFLEIGVQSEGTARKYLHEYLDELGVPGTSVQEGAYT